MILLFNVIANTSQSQKQIRGTDTVYKIQSALLCENGYR